MILVLIFSIPFLVMLARKPVLRRLALRNAARRPRETMLVLLGSLLGTAIITGSLIVGDTLGASIRRGAFTQLGPVDEMVITNDPGVAAAADQKITALKSPDIDGVLPLSTITVAAATTGADPKAEPTALLLETDFARAASFGGDSGATGISGSTPVAGTAVVSKDLARTLDVSAGSTISVFAYGKKLDLKVARTLPRIGVAGLHNGFGSASSNLFVAPGTIASLAKGAPPTAALPEHIVAVSNRGGVITDKPLSRSVTNQVVGALSGLPNRVEQSKVDLLDAADQQGKQFTQLFQGLGAFGVIAGVLLLVNIFVMLAQERKTELGMLRAVGLRRAGLVGSFSLEGWLYGLGSAALGTLAGIGIGRIIVFVASGIFGQPGRFSLEIHFRASGASIQGGFLAGFMISLITVMATSLWVSRLNVIRAIRDLPDPENAHTRRLSQVIGSVLIALGGAIAAAGIAGQAAVPVLVGPAVLALGVYLAIRRFVSRRPLVTACSTGALVWDIAAFSLVPRAFRDAAIPVFVVQGIVLTASAVALVTVNQDAIGAFIRRIGGGSRNMSLRLGLAYPLARRFRTGMILSMYSLVVFTLTFITIFSHLFGGQLDSFTRKGSGGFTIEVNSNAANPVPADAVRARPDVAAVSAVRIVAAQFKPDKDPTAGFVNWPAMAFDQTMIDRGGPSLNKRAPEFADDAAAYRAVFAPGSNSMIVNQFFLQNGAAGPPKAGPEVGDSVELRDPLTGRAHPVRIVGLAQSVFGEPLAFVPPDVMNQTFGSRAVPTTLYVTVKPGLDAEAVASSINGAFLANGADAKTFRRLVTDTLARQEQFFRLMQGYLALGLVVGVAGLGVVMVRAVRERRRQVGVLRALGFGSVAVRRAFVAESAFVALEGIVIGTSLAVVTAWRLVGNADFGADLGFSVPWVQLLFLVAGTFIASMLATAMPAQQASKIRPAVALRIAD